MHLNCKKFPMLFLILASFLFIAPNLVNSQTNCINNGGEFSADFLLTADGYDDYYGVCAFVSVPYGNLGFLINLNSTNKPDFESVTGSVEMKIQQINGRIAPNGVIKETYRENRSVLSDGSSFRVLTSGNYIGRYKYKTQYTGRQIVCFVTVPVFDAIVEGAINGLFGAAISSTIDEAAGSLGVTFTKDQRLALHTTVQGLVSNINSNAQTQQGRRFNTLASAISGATGELSGGAAVGIAGSVIGEIGERAIDRCYSKAQRTAG